MPEGCKPRGEFLPTREGSAAHVLHPSRRRCVRRFRLFTSDRGLQRARVFGRDGKAREQCARAAGRGLIQSRARAAGRGLIWVSGGRVSRGRPGDRRPFGLQMGFRGPGFHRKRIQLPGDDRQRRPRRRGRRRHDRHAATGRHGRNGHLEPGQLHASHRDRDLQPRDDPRIRSGDRRYCRNRPRDDRADHEQRDRHDDRHGSRSLEQHGDGGHDGRRPWSRPGNRDVRRAGSGCHERATHLHAAGLEPRAGRRDRRYGDRHSSRGSDLRRCEPGLCTRVRDRHVRGRTGRERRHREPGDQGDHSVRARHAHERCERRRQ